LAAILLFDSGFLEGTCPLAGARDTLLPATSFFAAALFLGAAWLPFLEAALISLSESGRAEEVRTPFLYLSRAVFAALAGAVPADFAGADLLGDVDFGDVDLGADGRSLALTRAALDGASYTEAV
jgi:hypothetical protein